MSTRFYYLRDTRHLSRRADGTPTRGTPVAVIASKIDKTSNTIQYAFASIHKADSFVKDLGRKIAVGRLQTAPLVINGLPDNGHDITSEVMNDLIDRYEDRLAWEAAQELYVKPEEDGPIVIPQRVKALAEKWLRRAAKPKAEVFPPAVQVVRSP